MGYKCMIRCSECDGTGRLDDRWCPDCEGGELPWEFDCEESIRSQVDNIKEIDLVPLLIWVVAEYAIEGASAEEIQALEGVNALKDRIETPKSKRRRAA